MSVKLSGIHRHLWNLGLVPTEMRKTLKAWCHLIKCKYYQCTTGEKLHIYFFMGSPSDCLRCLWQDSRDLSNTTHEIWQFYIDFLSIVVRWFIIWRPSKSIKSAFFKIDSAVTEGSGYIYCTALAEFLYSAKSVSQTFSWYILFILFFCLIFYRQ